MELLRPHFAKEGFIPCVGLADIPAGRIVNLAGVVLIRQRPGSAKGVIFITIEDETGVANLIVWPDKMEEFRRVVLGSRLIGVRGEVQREGIVTHIVSQTLEDYSDRLGYLTSDTPLWPDVADGMDQDCSLPPSILGTQKTAYCLPPNSRDFQ